MVPAITPPTVHAATVEKMTSLMTSRSELVPMPGPYRARGRVCLSMIGGVSRSVWWAFALLASDRMAAASFACESDRWTTH